MRSTIVLFCSLFVAAAAMPAESAPRAKKPKAKWDVANISNPRVDYWISRFQTDKRDKFILYLHRKAKYEGMIAKKLRARGMPRDLIYLAMIESGFNPQATSVAGARGLWQLVPDTARRYGLKVNHKVDERTNPEKSTDAALEYLRDLHDRFDCWYLSAAAYNTGENRVGRIMREVMGSEAGNDRNYYTIWKRLPGQTRDYIPVMIAAARIAKDPAKYGFDKAGPSGKPDVAVADADGLTEGLPTVTRAELEFEHDHMCDDDDCPVRNRKHAAHGGGGESRTARNDQ